MEPAIEPSNVEPPYGVGEMDWDGDGFLVDVDDCDDEDSNAYPGAAPLDSATACMRDFDGDGYGDMEPVNSEVQPGTDCDDMDININPGTNDTPGDGTDSNCDGED
ncbi:MAG: MopE-related protein [Myxococcota bacterium]|nr:MopE-related protein [Myxococcota bacterium]